MRTALRTLTLGEAAKVAHKSKATISKAVKSGKLSAKRLDDGSFSIDPVELSRVFPANEARERLKPKANGGVSQQVNTDLAIKVATLEVELEATRRDLARVETERDRERDQLTSHIHDLKAMITDQRSKVDQAPHEEPRTEAPLSRSSGLFGFLRGKG